MIIDQTLVRIGETGTRRDRALGDDYGRLIRAGLDRLTRQLSAG
jgi:hypothetical protein